MDDRFFERRKKKYFTEDIENSTSKEIILKLLLPCEGLFHIIGREGKSASSKRFLSEITESTNKLLNPYKETNFFLNMNIRPCIFELIIHKKEELISDKRFSSILVGELETSLNEMGFRYGTPLTDEDIVKILMISRYINRPDANIKLSINDDEIYCENRSSKRR